MLVVAILFLSCILYGITIWIDSSERKFKNDNIVNSIIEELSIETRSKAPKFSAYIDSLNNQSIITKDLIKDIDSTWDRDSVREVLISVLMISFLKKYQDDLNATLKITDISERAANFSKIVPLNPTSEIMTVAYIYRDIVTRDVKSEITNRFLQITKEIALMR